MRKDQVSFITYLLIPVINKNSQICRHERHEITFEVEAHNFEFTKHVSDEQHPSSVANTNEPLVGVI